MSKQNSKEKFIVILYHDVTDNPSEFLEENNLFVTPHLFEYQISIIKKNFAILEPGDIVKHSFNSNISVLITFDDVFKGAFKNAAPIMSQFGMPGIFFLNYGDMEDGIFWAGLLFYLMKYDRQFKLKPQKDSFGYRLPLISKITPSFLENYLLIHWIDTKKVNDYIGEFATVDDLKKCIEKYKNIYYGNHLFRHYNAITLSNQELIDAYELNEQKIKKLPNYVPFFSFPFGQPDTCYTDNSINIIESCGAKYIFSAFPQINRVPLGRVIHRIHLDESHDTENKILRRIFLRGVKPLLRKGFYKLGIKPFWR